MNNLIQNECKLVSGNENMNFENVTEMLSDAFWCVGIKITEVKEAAKNSAVVVGIKYRGQQISYARVISDKTRFAYICDVYVHEKFRGNGLCKAMIDHILSCSELKAVYQWVLVTKDAHQIYEKSGFRKLENPEIWMEIRNERPKKIE